MEKKEVFDWYLLEFAWFQGIYCVVYFIALSSSYFKYKYAFQVNKRFCAISKADEIGLDNNLTEYNNLSTLYVILEAFVIDLLID